MFVVTNRRVYNRRKGLDVFGDTPNENGSNELRIVKVSKGQGGGYDTEVLKDRMTVGEARVLKQRFKLDIDERKQRYASLGVACEVLVRARREKRHVRVYVHGYNNDMEDVLKTSEALESLYGVIVLPFSWPANGGGAVTGTAAYLSDKRDARASNDALNQFFGKIHDYHLLLTHSRRNELLQQAKDEHPNNMTAANERHAELLSLECQINLSLICHSMGNYVLKYALQPGTGTSRRLIFDNISLVAADANHAAHPDWVERLDVRNRIYIVINEDDFALAASRVKPGEEQLVRLGHYLKDLSARNARYIDVTGADAVGNAHGYFTGKPVEKNEALKALFLQAFRGQSAESMLQYADDINAYRLI